MTQYYALAQIGGPVYGIGTTEMDAFENALPWLDNGTSEDDIFDGPLSQAVDGQLVIVKCSQKLAKTVKADGGNQVTDWDGDILVMAIEL